MLSGLYQSFKTWRRERRTARRFARRQAWSEGLSVEETFDKIYTDRKWGSNPDVGPYFSGDGSRAEMSASYEQFVIDFLNRHGDLKSLVDIGCGDFQVSRRILAGLSRPIDYFGCDASASVVAHNKAKYGTDAVRFAAVNAVDEDPPTGDVVTIRQVLQHLSNSQISAILRRLSRLYRVAIITESLPTKLVEANRDIRHGIAVRIPLGSGVYIDREPFGLDVSETMETSYSDKEFLRTSVVWFDRD